MESSLAIAQAKYWHLRQVALFAQLAAPEVRRIGELFDTALVEAGERIYQFGDPADRIYILKSGRIKVTRASSTGKEFILYFISPGEIFGELAITGKEFRTGTATVLEDAFICAIPRCRSTCRASLGGAKTVRRGAFSTSSARMFARV